MSIYWLGRSIKILYIKHVNYMLKPFISSPIFCLFDQSISWKRTFTMSHCECEFADFSLYSEPFISVSFLDINQPHIENIKKNPESNRKKKLKMLNTGSSFCNIYIVLGITSKLKIIYGVCGCA